LIKQSNGHSLDDVDRIPLSEALNHQEIGICQPDQHEEDKFRFQASSSSFQINRNLSLEIGYCDIQRMGILLILIRHIIISLEDTECIDEGIVAVLIAKAEIFIYFVEEIFVILFYVF
jgi:hypothetical protein